MRLPSNMNRVPASHTIEAYGVKGFKNTPWRKTFRNNDTLNFWCDRNDASCEGTRVIEGREEQFKKEIESGRVQLID